MPKQNESQFDLALKWSYTDRYQNPQIVKDFPNGRDRSNHFKQLRQDLKDVGIPVGKYFRTKAPVEKLLAKAEKIHPGKFEVSESIGLGFFVI